LTKKKFYDDPSENDRGVSIFKDPNGDMADPDPDEEAVLYNDVSANAYEV
jgi:hypothetical protein